MFPPYLDTYKSIVHRGALVTSDSATPWTVCSLPGSSVNGFSGNDTGVGCLSLLQGNLPNPGFEPGSPAWQADSLPTELPGKPLLYN